MKTIKRTISIVCLSYVAATFFLSGCCASQIGMQYMELVRIIPENGKGLSIMTSEINKALRGENAKALVCVKNEIVLSNANDTISVGLKGIKTRRDFAHALIDAYGRVFSMLNDYWIYHEFMLEDQDSDHPILKVEIACPASFKLDSNGGYITEVKPLESLIAAEKGANCMLEALVVRGDPSAKQVHAAFSGQISRLCPKADCTVHFVIYGDDEDPILVIDEHGDANGLERWVRKDERIAINSKLGCVHFFRKRRWWLLWLF